jgi:activator of 2-hydroxyglutaryl-CoA dehydratase
MCGGVASNRGVINAISRDLNNKIIVAPLAQLSGALGAALIASEEARKRKAAGAPAA